MRHTEPKKEELIAHIRNSLKKHEEPYTPGAWERFNQKPVSKRPVLWFMRLGGVAAVLALGLMLFWFKGEETTIPAQVAQSKTEGTTLPPAPVAGKLAPAAIAAGASGDGALAKAERGGALLAQAHLPNRENKGFVRDDIMGRAIDNDQNQGEEAVSEQTAAVDKIAYTQNDVTEKASRSEAFEQVEENALAQNNNGTTKELAHESRFTVNGKSGKWSLALMLAPSFSNSNELNLGYGLSMSYRLSERLSLNSGLSYSKMNASKNFQTNIGMSPVLLNNAKSLEMTSEEITGIDIPLELRYHFNRHIYANMGLSGFVVLSQNRANTFVQEVVVKSASSNTGGYGGGISSGGEGQDPFGPKGQFADSYITNQRTTEQVASSALNRSDYMGFYNLSIGYSRRIYKNNTLAIEPFVKLPIRGAADDLRMVGKGIRLKVGF